MIFLRSLLFQIGFYLMTAALGVLGLPLLLAPADWVLRFGTFWSDATLHLLRWTVGLDYEVRGTELLPAGAAIIAMKHQSAWDTLAAPVVFDRPAIIFKRELGYIPIYGWYVRKAGMIPLDRGGGAKALKGMLAACRPVVAAGRPILIFPEGTRSAVGVTLPYQPGVYALARQLAVPIVPVAVNSGLFWGRRAFLKRPGRIIVRILPSLVAERDRQTTLAALAAAIESETSALVAEARAPGG